MHLISIASHFPEFSYTQSECLSAMKEASFWTTLTDRSHRILDKIFTSPTGINKRHFVLQDLPSAWDRNAQELSESFEHHAPPLGISTVQKALDKAELLASEIDILLVATCTGQLCPGLSSYIAEGLGCDQQVHTQDITGHGCGAAVPLMHTAAGYLTLHPHATVVTLTVEVCSSAFYISNEVDVLISTCLFGDGASAAVWKSTGGSHSVSNFHSLLLPNEREKVRFKNANGKLKNQLHKSVPALTAKAAKQLLDLYPVRPDVLLTHGGGRDVIEKLETSLEVDHLGSTRHVLENYGNLSSPSVLVALEHQLAQQTDDASLWLCGFGAGFSAHSCVLEKLT